MTLTALGKVPATTDVMKEDLIALRVDLKNHIADLNVDLKQHIAPYMILPYLVLKSLLWLYVLKWVVCSSI